MGARRLGLTTILVKPLSGYDLPHTRVLRLIEKRLLSQWLASGRSVHLGAR
jgi:predicted HAD superfamily phosphohydrolase YqeG